MSRFFGVILPSALLVALVLPASMTYAGTQDFTLVNQTGATIYSLHVSETANDSWEEDVLGDDTLLNGGRMNIAFSGRQACLWDILAVDPDGNEVYWTGIDLCRVAVVILKCDGDECWAEYE